MFPHYLRAWLQLLRQFMICPDFTEIYQDTSLNSVTTTNFEFLCSTKLACNASNGHVYECLFREDTCCLRYGCQSFKQFLTLLDWDENICWCHLIACNWAHSGASRCESGDRGVCEYWRDAKRREYRYASLNDGDTFWEMRRQAISSLCERHRVYLHKPR